METLSLPIHDAANLLPAMTAEEYHALVTDMKEHGQRDPITLFDGAILDGRHRYRASQELGLTPRFEDWSGDDPTQFVISRNLKRRHLTTGQRALLAADYAKAPVGKSANLQDRLPTVAEAAGLFGVSERSIQTARRVADAGKSELIAALQSGDITLNEADQQTREPIDPVVADSPSMRRQAWLETGVVELRARFKDVGYIVPAAVRISVAPPSRSRLGVAYPAKVSSDNHHEVYLGTGTDNSLSLLATLAHELCHTSLPATVRHGREFATCAAAVGLLPPWTATKAGPEFVVWVEDFIRRHGPYPGGAYVEPKREPMQTEPDEPEEPEPELTKEEVEQQRFASLKWDIDFRAFMPSLNDFRSVTPKHLKELHAQVKKRAKQWTALADKLERQIAKQAQGK